MGFKRTISIDTTAGLPSRGIHVAECIEAELQPIKGGPNKGEDNLVLNFSTQTPGEKGRRVKTWIALLPQTAWKYTRVFQAFGVKPKKDGDTDLAITDKMFVGKQVRIQVDHSENNSGEPMAEITAILPLGDGKSKLIEDVDDDEDLDVTPASSKSRKRSAPEPEDDDEAESSIDDDLPF